MREGSLSMESKTVGKYQKMVRGKEKALGFTFVSNTQLRITLSVKGHNLL